MSAPVATGLDRAIETAVAASAPALDDLVRRSRPTGKPTRSPLIVKYTAPKWSAVYRAGAGIRISDSIGFTWGTGSYVTPLAFPYSSAIFGRVGVVAEFDSTGWRAFDATDPAKQDLYLDWARSQPMFRLAALTMHSALYNHLLRDLFRERYAIDCVLFHPDQRSLTYTSRTDVWMAVADWQPHPSLRRLATGTSSRFHNVKVAVLVEEEFEDTLHGRQRAALLRLTTSRPAASATITAIMNAYDTGALLRIRA